MPSLDSYHRHVCGGDGFQPLANARHYPNESATGLLNLANGRHICAANHPKPFHVYVIGCHQPAGLSSLAGNEALPPRTVSPQNCGQYPKTEPASHAAARRKTSTRFCQSSNARSANSQSARSSSIAKSSTPVMLSTRFCKRVCATLSRMDARWRNANGRASQMLKVFGQATTTIEPRNRPFHNPTLR